MPNKKQIGFIINLLLIVAMTGILYGQGSPDIIWSISGHSNSVSSVSFSQNGQKVISGGGTEAKIWQASNGNLLQTIPGFASDLLSVSISPNDSLLAAGYVVGTFPPGGVMDIIDISQGTILYHYGGCFVKFSPDGSLVASAGGGVNRYVVIHRVSDGMEIGSYYNGPGYITDIAFSPDGQIIAAALTTNTINLWDIASGTILHTLTGHTDDVSTIDFSPDGEMLASGAGGYDNPSESTIKLWRVSDGTLLRTLDGHLAWVFDVSFSADGQTLISCGRDGISPNIYPNIKIWRVSDGTLLKYYDQGLGNAAYSIDFAPDGQTFCYGRSDGTVTVALNPFLTTISHNISNLPHSVELYQNYPNPFNPSTTFEFALPHAEFVTLKIYNILGEELATLVSKKMNGGKNKYDWNASGLASGMYLYRLEAGEFGETKKMLLLK